jgi:ribosome recycling factor
MNLPMKQQMKVSAIFSFTVQAVLALVLVVALLLVLAFATPAVHAAEKELKKSRDTTQEAGAENPKKISRKARAAALEKAKTEAENAKVAVRNNRKDALDMVKDLKTEGLSEDMSKDAETEIQNITNGFVKKVDDLLELKEKDIMTI